jgi:hypothetical protein
MGFALGADRAEMKPGVAADMRAEVCLGDFWGTGHWPVKGLFWPVVGLF